MDRKIEYGREPHFVLLEHIDKHGTVLSSSLIPLYKMR